MPRVAKKTKAPAREPISEDSLLAYSDGAGWWSDIPLKEQAESGVTVSADSSLKYAPVWQALRVVCGDIAMLPLPVYTRMGADRQRLPTHPGDVLLNRRPNRLMTRHSFIKTIQAHVELYGNGYAWIWRNNRGLPEEMYPLSPDRTEPILSSDNELFYQTWLADPETHVESKFTIPAYDVLHIRGIGFTGLKGYSVFEYARNSFGLGMGQEQHGSGMMKNGARPSVVLESPNPLKEEVARATAKAFQSTYGGAKNAGKVAVLHTGVKATAFSLSNVDAQWLESREFQRNEVASWFNLPPHKVGDLRRATFSNIEHQQIEYVQGSLMDRLMAWKHECDAKLRTEREIDSDEVYFEWLVDALLRGDKATRIDVQTKQLTYGILTPNQVCQQENLPSFGPDGDKRWMPANLIPIEKALAAEAASSKAGGMVGDPAEEPGVVNAIRVGLTRIISVERNRVREAAKKPAKFIDWLPAFYEGFADTVADAVTQYGGDPSIARMHVATSRAILDKLCDDPKIGPDRFEAAVIAATENWLSRAAALAEEIRSDTICST